MNKNLQELLASYDPSVADLVLKIRDVLLSELEGIQEEIDISGRMVGYGFGKGYSNLICTFILSKKGLKVGFYKGTELNDPEGLLDGRGNVHKYVAISQISDINNPAFHQLIKDAHKQYIYRKNQK